MRYRYVEEVHRERGPSGRILKAAMVVFAVLFLFCGIFLSRGFMLPCFLMAALYFVYDLAYQKDYEYVLEDGHFTITVIRGKRHRTAAHEIDLQDMIVTAPHDHPSVDAWRKGSGNRSAVKYDYTSYRPGVPYYTMICREDGKEYKFLLDLTDEMLEQMKREFPQKVNR